jgi:hypothetical protein
LIRQGPHWKRFVQQFFYCCVCILYLGNVSTEPLPSNDKEIFLPSLCLATIRGFLPSRCLATIGEFLPSLCRPIFRGGARHRQNSKCQTEINIWSWAPDGTRYQDGLIDRTSVVKWLWLWATIGGFLQSLCLATIRRFLPSRRPAMTGGGGGVPRQTQRQQRVRISLLLFFQNKENRLKRRLCFSIYICRSVYENSRTAERIFMKCYIGKFC